MNMYEIMQTPEMQEALLHSSVSVEDAKLRGSEYAKMFSRNADMKEAAETMGLLQKNFSGYAETPLLANQYFNASVASYVSSFAGFMSIERDFDQPNGIFYWYDVLGVADMRNVVPNLGADNFDGLNIYGGFKVNVTVTNQTAYSSLVGRKIIPGSLRVRVKTPSAAYVLVDNGQGEFLAVAGKISASEINYLNGKVDFTLTAALSGDPNTESIIIEGKEDVTGTPCNTAGASNEHANDKRFLGKMQQLALATVPDMLVAEYNIASLGAMKKSTGSDMASFLFGKLREIYTKTINKKLVNTLEEGYAGTTMTGLDLRASAMTGVFYDYRSRVDLFDAYLIDVESNLAAKAVKGVSTTAYVAGLKASSQFSKAGMIGKWKKNTDTTYINDLLGWYDGVPVLRSTDVQEEANEGVFYAIHKTADGQMAPLARGIFMPLTDTPTIGNYNNPTQMAAGIYYQEGTKYLAPELVQKVSFNL